MEARSPEGEARSKESRAETAAGVPAPREAHERREELKSPVSTLPLPLLIAGAVTGTPEGETSPCVRDLGHPLPSSAFRVRTIW